MNKTEILPVNKTKQNTSVPNDAIYFPGGILMRIFMVCLKRFPFFEFRCIL